VNCRSTWKVLKRIRSNQIARTLDEILLNEKPKIVANARVKADEALLNIHLAEIREKMKMTQVEMAEALGIKQPTIAGLEKEGRDLKLSSLKRYVEATGGKLCINIELPDGSHYGFAI